MCKMDCKLHYYLEFLFSVKDKRDVRYPYLSIQKSESEQNQIQ